MTDELSARIAEAIDLLDPHRKLTSAELAQALVEWLDVKTRREYGVEWGGRIQWGTTLRNARRQMGSEFPPDAVWERTVYRVDGRGKEIQS